MRIAHQHHDDGGTFTALTVVALALVVIGYLGLAHRRRHDGRGWCHWRSAAFAAGTALLAFALTAPAVPFPDTDFRQHMLQHLFIGMLAPLGLMLGAPVTLILRSVRPRYGRLIGRALRSPAGHVIAHPVTALVLNIGALALLYLTPLYSATVTTPALHHLVHAHFLLAGYLFAWVVAGRDPAPHRPSIPTRLVILGIAIAAHSCLAQLMYAGLVVQIPVPTEQLRGAADLMYYGGDIAELLLALALLTSWRPRRSAWAAAPSPEPRSFGAPFQPIACESEKDDGVLGDHGGR